MKDMKYRELHQKLLELGARILRQNGSSHVIYAYKNGTVCVPKHKSVSPGSLRDIFKKIKEIEQRVVS